MVQLRGKELATRQPKIIIYFLIFQGKYPPITLLHDISFFISFIFLLQLLLLPLHAAGLVYYLHV